MTFSPQNWHWGQIKNKLFDKKDDLNFPVVNFPSIYSHISAAPAYEVYISQLIWYSRACGTLGFLIQGYYSQGSYWTKDSYWLSWSHHFESFTVATMTWLTIQNISVTNDHGYAPVFCKDFPVISPFMIYHRLFN